MKDIPISEMSAERLRMELQSALIANRLWIEMKGKDRRKPRKDSK